MNPGPMASRLTGYFGGRLDGTERGLKIEVLPIHTEQVLWLLLTRI